MTTKAITFSISPVAPYGLNKQKESSVLGPEWATELTNMYYGDDGILTNREGTQNQHTTSLTSFGTTVSSLHEYVDSSGSSLIIGSCASSPYTTFKVSGGTATSINGSITTPTGGYWKFQNYNGKCVGFQSGHAPIVISSVGGSFADISLSGTDQPTTAVDTVLSAFGRLWVIDGQFLKYSDLLDETAWNSYYSLQEYWGEGGDVGIALAEFNGNLIVFGKNHIIIYDGTGGPDDLVKTEVLRGVGIRGRDAYAQVGDDLWFLTNSGLMSLRRTVQEKSMPLVDISHNVRDYMNGFFVPGSAVDSPRYGIKAKVTYYRKRSLCIVTSGSTPTLFDTRGQLPDGSYRAVVWGLSGIPLVSLAGDLYFGSNVVTKYGSYGGDNRNYTTNANTGSIACRYVSSWFDLGFLDEGLRAKTKILKEISGKFYNGDTYNAGDLFIAWSTDFNNISFSDPVSAGQEKTRTLFDEINTDNVNTYKTPMNRSGQFFSIGFISQDSTNPLSSGIENQVKLYSFNVQLKVGKEVL